MKALRKRRFDPALWFLLPGFAGFGIFFIWPFILSLGYAFLDKPVNGTFVGLQNFIGLFQNQPFLKGLGNMLRFIGVSVPLNMLLSLGAALLIYKTGRHRAWFTLLFLIPLVIPSGSMVFFWKSFFSSGGYLNHLLTLAGLGKVNWLETEHAGTVVTLIFLWKNLGYNMVLFLSGLHNIPGEYYEAAAIDGAGFWGRLRYITLPGLLPSFVLTLIMSIINSFKIFKEIYLITGSYPHESVYVLQHFMNNMFSSLNYQKLTTAAVILVALITGLTQFLFRLERKVSL